MLSSSDTVGSALDSMTWSGRQGLRWQSGPASWTWITTVQQMYVLKADWMALEEQSGGRMAYFQSFDWCYKWAQHFASDGNQTITPSIRIIAVYKNDQLAMIWPMMQVTRRLGIKELTFIGEPLTQYGNILVDRRLTTSKDIKECWSAIIGESDADVVALNNFPVVSVLGSTLGPTHPTGTKSSTSIMDLSDFPDFASFLSSLKRSTRRNRKKRRNRLNNLGTIEHVVMAGGTMEYAALVELALLWKQTWLTETGRTSDILNQSRTRDFLKSLTDRVLLFSLQLDGRPIAIEIGFLDGGHFYSYLGAFDWCLRDYSPGKVQMEGTIRWAIDNNVRAYDLLGEPSTYKADWSNIDLALACHQRALTVKGLAYARFWNTTTKPFMKRLFYIFSVKYRKRMLSIVLGLRAKIGGIAVSADSKQRHGSH